MNFFRTVVVLVLSSSVVFADPVYEKYEEDRKLVKSAVEKLSKGKSRISPFQAVDAAYRLFSKVTFINRTRKEVTEILGDPTIRKVRAIAPVEPDLVFHLDSGYGGSVYTLKFRRGKVSSIEIRGLD